MEQMTLSILVVQNVRVMSDMLVSQVSKATITDLGQNREKINSLLEDQLGGSLTSVGGSGHSISFFAVRRRIFDSFFLFSNTQHGSIFLVCHQAATSWHQWSH
jgi:hypothetical protein